MTLDEGCSAWFEEVGSGGVARMGGTTPRSPRWCDLKDEGGGFPDGFVTIARAYREYMAAKTQSRPRCARQTAHLSAGALSVRCR